MKLPPQLQNHRKEIEAALTAPLLGEWPKEGDTEEAFVDADQPRAIGEALILALHDHLANARIAYVYRKDMKSRGKIILGKAKKAGGELTHFTEYDFVIAINWTYWKELSAGQRVALMDHELEHCGVDDEGGWTLVPHDVEEFGSIVRRWGLWKPDLVEFGNAVKNAAQLDLLAETPTK